MLRKLATFSVRRRWLVIVTWLLLVAGLNLAGQTYGGSFSNDLTVQNTDSQAAYDTLARQFPERSGDGMQVVIHDKDGVTGPDVRRAADDALSKVRGQPGVASATSPYDDRQPMVSKDGTTAMATVQFDQRAADISAEQIDNAQNAFDGLPDHGVQVEFGGPALNTESGPSGSEVIGLAAAVLVLLLVFGSVFAMLVPLVTALLALGLGIGTIHLLAEYVTIGTAGPVVAAMIGLGVGIDYALLVVTRHREGLAAGRAPKESIAIALATAGRSVLVAGTTVVIAILSLYLIGIPFVSTLGLVSAITVTTTLLAAVTLLPTLLGVFGGKLDRLRVRKLRLDHGGRHVSRWHRWTHHVQRRPWPYALASVALLAAMAVPLFSLRLGTADDGSAPSTSTERKAYDLIARSFGPGWTGPLVVTVHNDNPNTTAPEADRLRTEISQTPGVKTVSPPRSNDSGTTKVLTVVPTTSPDSKATEDLVHRLRDSVIPVQTQNTTTAHVGGATATAIDLADRLAERMAWFMAFVVGLSFLLLMVEFRSIFVPVKAALMNLLSVGAAYGAVVAVFQWGWLSEATGVQAGPIESFAPMMLFAVLFGLSMDYEVFLLSRVREEYLRTGNADDALADGIATTARVITAAASVMVVVFASFMLNDERVVNMFGFGLAIAIAIDATVVRLVLVPALMAIAKRGAWYMPRWLDRLLPGTKLQPRTFDPFEAQPDEPNKANELDAEKGHGKPAVPRHADLLTARPPRSESGATLNDAPDGVPAPTRARASDATPNGAAGFVEMRGDLHAYDALELLRITVEERRAYQQRYEDALADLADLSRRYDSLLGALRTLQDATGPVPAETEGARTGEAHGADGPSDSGEAAREAGDRWKPRT